MASVHDLMHWKVTGFIPLQDARPGCRFGPQLLEGHVGGNRLIFLSSLSPFLSL